MDKNKIRADPPLETECIAVLLRAEAALESCQDLSLQITNPHVADVMDQVQERAG
jgi:hypothetical protein